MSKIGAWILPVVVIGIVVSGIVKKVPVFDCFIEGAKDGITTMWKLMPTLVGLVVAVSMLKSSGGLDFLTWLLSPFAKTTNIPNEVMPLAVVTPLSGSGSLAVFENILKSFGPDSYIGRVASVMMGSTETTFYCVSMYYGSVGVKKSRHTIPAALAADFVSFAMSAFSVRLLMGK